ncbi:MAG: thiamine-phosphate kinase [Alphaproteobacteria bacterium]|nr:thiamine-phosphate kinase [Alphaproteobacteria bacterium]
MAGRLGEFDRIAQFFSPLAAGFPGALGLTDDAALVDPGPGYELVVTTDALVADVHFRKADPPDRIAQKALRVNLSDLASMGAEPVCYTLATILPAETDEAWLAAFVRGLAADQAEFGISLAGGDSVRTTGPATFSVTAMGRVEKGQALRRSGAKPGDKVYVSGTIGDGALGLAVLMGEIRDDEAGTLAGRYLLPRPRLVLGRALRGRASAALDVSDGLVADLGHVAETSGVGLVIEADRVPLSSPARRALDGDSRLIATILTGGDDYELAFTASETLPESLAGVPIACIGRVEAGSGVTVLDRQGRPVTLTAGGYRHF